jgi:hypothetical protein
LKKIRRYIQLQGCVEERRRSDTGDCIKKTIKLELLDINEEVIKKKHTNG